MDTKNQDDSTISNMDCPAISRESTPMSPLTTPPDTSRESSARPSKLEVITSTSLNISVRSDTYTMLLSAQATTRSSVRPAAHSAQTAIKRTMAHMKPDVMGNPAKRTRSYYSSSGKGASNEVADCLDAELESPQEDDTNIAESDQATKRARVTARTSTRQAVQGPAQRSQPAGKPQVWANGRGSLCEALPYFRAFKGSLHSTNVVAKGFLIDQEVEYGDVFGAQVIISSV